MSLTQSRRFNRVAHVYEERSYMASGKKKVFYKPTGIKFAYSVENNMNLKQFSGGDLVIEALDTTGKQTLVIATQMPGIQEGALLAVENDCYRVSKSSTIPDRGVVQTYLMTLEKYAIPSQSRYTILGRYTCNDAAKLSINTDPGFEHPLYWQPDIGSVQLQDANGGLYADNSYVNEDQLLSVVLEENLDATDRSMELAQNVGVGVVSSDNMTLYGLIEIMATGDPPLDEAEAVLLSVNNIGISILNDIICIRYVDAGSQVRHYYLNKSLTRGQPFVLGFFQRGNKCAFAMDSYMDWRPVLTNFTDSSGAVFASFAVSGPSRSYAIRGIEFGRFGRMVSFQGILENFKSSI